MREAGAAEVYADAFTGTKAHRPQLDKLLEVMQAGDTLKVTKLDRIARSATQGIELVQSLLDKGITVHVLNMGMMDNTATGKLIRNIMLVFAEFERDMIVERTQEGKAILLLNKNIGNLSVLKESGNLIWTTLQRTHERSRFMANIPLGPREVAGMNREFQCVVEIFVRIAFRSIGRQEEQLDFILVPVQPSGP